ncbi:MAG: hypothetical protein LBJ78_04250 [Puniceicoccales bacterium]|jgi:hypothetical protein|nr:hypothetical protein [Puniceicoccales bacterium]
MKTFRLVFIAFLFCVKFVFACDFPVSTCVDYNALPPPIKLLHAKLFHIASLAGTGDKNNLACALLIHFHDNTYAEIPIDASLRSETDADPIFLKVPTVFPNWLVFGSQEPPPDHFVPYTTALKLWSLFKVHPHTIAESRQFYSMLSNPQRNEVYTFLFFERLKNYFYKQAQFTRPPIETRDLIRTVDSEAWLIAFLYTYRDRIAKKIRALVGDRQIIGIELHCHTTRDMCPFCFAHMNLLQWLATNDPINSNPGQPSHFFAELRSRVGIAGTVPVTIFVSSAVPFPDSEWLWSAPFSLSGFSLQRVNQFRVGTFDAISSAKEAGILLGWLSIGRGLVSRTKIPLIQETPTYEIEIDPTATLKTIKHSVELRGKKQEPKHSFSVVSNILLKDCVIILSARNHFYEFNPSLVASVLGHELATKLSAGLLDVIRSSHSWPLFAVPTCLHYTLQNVPGDGNCGVWALLQGINPGVNYLGERDARIHEMQELRRLVAARVIAPVMLQAKKDTMLDRIRTPATAAGDTAHWIDTEDFQHFARYLQRPIGVIVAGEGFRFFDEHGHAHVANNLEAFVALLTPNTLVVYQEGVHYQTVTTVHSPTAADPLKSVTWQLPPPSNPQGSGAVSYEDWDDPFAFD